MQLVLGIDTSNYTTSLCAVAFETGALVAEARKLLPVHTGERGLRQSDALFFHVQQLPHVMDELMTSLKSVDPVWCGVGVSVHPRPQLKSYMPVFRAGESFADTFARALRIPVVRTSHQEGHLAAAQYFLDDIPTDEPFLAVHISGGTSDVLCASPSRFGYAVEPVAEGADLHAGQFVDRVGVALGMPFPAGPHLEQLAMQAQRREFRLGAQLVQNQLSFSGPCSAALRALNDGVPPEEVAFAVETCVANTVAKAVTAAARQHPNVRYCVIAGGVAANQHIRARIVHRLGIQSRALQVRFAPPRYSSDNALGVACIARKHLVSLSS